MYFNKAKKNKQKNATKQTNAGIFNIFFHLKPMESLYQLSCLKIMFSEKFVLNQK